MLLPLLIIAVAVVAGYLAGGRLRGFETLHLRWWFLAILGLAMQAVVIPTEGDEMREAVAAGVLVASYPVLLVFLGVNLRVPGFAVIFVGLALNLAVIASAWAFAGPLARAGFQPVYAMAIGVMLGGVLQLGCRFPRCAASTRCRASAWAGPPCARPGAIPASDACCARWRRHCSVSRWPSCRC